MNIRRVGERHKIVRLADSGFGVDARVGLGGPSSYEALLIRSLQHDLVKSVISRAGSRNERNSKSRATIQKDDDVPIHYR